MVGMLLLALAAIQAGPQMAGRPVPPHMDCRLVAANGSFLGFGLDARQNHGSLQAKFSPAAGSVWPEAASAFLDPLAPSTANAKYRVGSGSNAMILELGLPYPNQSGQFVELREARDAGEGLLVAHGYCSAEPSPRLAASGPAAGADAVTALRDPAAWPEDCVVMARDGRRSRIRYRVGNHVTAFEPVDQGIWPAGRISVPRLSPPPPPANNGIRTNFATMLAGPEENRPSFYEVAFIDEAAHNLVIMLRFHRLASAAHPSDDSGYAICGWRNVTVGS